MPSQPVRISGLQNTRDQSRRPSAVAAVMGAAKGGMAKHEPLRSDHASAMASDTAVALVIHEMITNSAKYGALSDNRGRVEIATALDALGRLTIDWSEHGGPPVADGLSSSGLAGRLCASF